MNVDMQTRLSGQLPKPKLGWVLLAVVYGLTMFLLAQLVAGFTLVAYGTFFKNLSVQAASDWAQHAIVAQFGFVLLAETLTIIGVYMYVRYAQRRLFSDIGVGSLHISQLGWALAGMAGYMGLYMIVAALIYNFVPSIDLEQKQEIGFDGAHAPAELMMTLLSLVVFAPLAEEILFRGFIYTNVRALFRARYAIVCTSVLFAVGHLQFGSGAPLLWVAAIDTFILSCVLCVVREKTGSIWPAVLIHMLKNFIAFAALFLVK